MSWGFALTLACVHTPYAWADPAAGQKIFEANECGACHQTSGPVDIVPVAERSKIKGPPLWFAGSKFQPEWLIAWLEKPVPIFRVKYGTLIEAANGHPALSAADAADVGSYLMNLTDPEVKTGAVKMKKLSRRKMFKGEKLFTKKQVCFGCHQFPSRQGKIGGFTGPSLVDAGKRLVGDWTYAFIKDPTRYYPNGRMPVYGDQAFEPFTEKELKLLVQYIGNF
ncbi:MAG: c-type cytochrome [Alphaproteobacteria bacterium]